MLRWEAVVAALTGSAAGTVLGVSTAAAALAGAAHGGYRQMTVPVVPLLALCGLAVAGSTAAALLTGRRVGRLVVVEALADV
jgi:hypothetical protein